MKLIIISQRIDNIFQRNEIRDSLDQQLTNFLIKGGYLPVAIPNILLNQSEIEKNKYLEKWLSTLNPDGILLSGGNDIGEFESRDITEKYLLDYAYKTKKPLLGICRGMQLMATWAGCGLKKVEHHAATYHKIKFKDKILEVNSYHNYAINFCPKNFSVLAKSPDNVIEAIKHNYLNWEGWMWHPEREKIFTKFDLKNLRKIFN